MHQKRTIRTDGVNLRVRGMSHRLCTCGHFNFNNRFRPQAAAAVMCVGCREAPSKHAIIATRNTNISRTLVKFQLCMYICSFASCFDLLSAADICVTRSSKLSALWKPRYHSRRASRFSILGDRREWYMSACTYVCARIPSKGTRILPLNFESTRAEHSPTTTAVQQQRTWHRLIYTRIKTQVFPLFKLRHPPGFQVKTHPERGPCTYIHLALFVYGAINSHGTNARVHTRTYKFVFVLVLVLCPGMNEYTPTNKEEPSKNIPIIPGTR